MPIHTAIAIIVKKTYAAALRTAKRYTSWWIKKR